jgi:hypothetical protein
MALLTGCATHLSEKWNVYNAGPFSFSMPSSFQKNSMHGIDSYVSVFTNQDMTLSFDYGAYSGDPLDRYNKRIGYVSHTESIAGHNVQIASFDPGEASGNRFKHIIAASFLGIGLTMTVECREESDYDQVIKIFRSVTFK